jgi:hypothetical protein
MLCAAPAARCDERSGLAESLASDVTDAAIGTGIAPGPADRIVEHREGFALAELADGFGAI